MTDKTLAYTAFRLLFGLNMFMHGAVRLGSNYGVFVDSVQSMFADAWLPMWLVTLEARVIPGIEIAVGALIFVGYKTRWALVAGMALLATLLFGMVILENWEIVARHLIYALCLFVLLYNSESNRVSIDNRFQA
ncbi:MAG: DoxX family protein [Gammaproteobacteria bacterium]|jgi:thiosulfate dehydrogenase [quinone] large subunit